MFVSSFVANGKYGGLGVRGFPSGMHLQLGSLVCAHNAMANAFDQIGICRMDIGKTDHDGR
jgi:hypothetical protein